MFQQIKEQIETNLTISYAKIDQQVNLLKENGLIKEETLFSLSIDLFITNLKIQK
jgi:hypothetical protein